MKAAFAMVRALHEEEGVTHVFGHPGGAILPFYDALYDSPITHHLMRHESGASFAADGFAHATGQVGVCVATSGPGATNLVTGIASAWMDSIPILAITGQVPRPMIGLDAFQESDVTGITLPITKHNWLVLNPDEALSSLKEAFFIAAHGRPGPVLVDVPRDVQQQEVTYHYPKKADIRGFKPTTKGHPGQIRKAAEALQAAERPLIMAGGGAIASNASKELHEFATTHHIPVITTLMGKGAFPERHDLFLGQPGMHGTKYGNHTIMQADWIIGVGMRFDDRVVGLAEHFAPQAKFIHIDVDPAEIGKNKQAHIPIVGEARQILHELTRETRPRSHDPWLQQIAQWKKEMPLGYKKKSGNGVMPQNICELLNQVAPDAIITTDVGQHQMWMMQLYQCNEPRQFLTSGGLGAMGYGLPAAMGAKAGRPDKTVINVNGDGSFLMSCMNLPVSVDDHLPITIVIFNNHYLGMVRQWQDVFYKQRYSGSSFTESKTDFVKVAEGFGAEGLRVTKDNEVEDALKDAIQAQKKGKTMLLDVHIDPKENVSPMVPPGGRIDQMMDLAG
ncbi:MAG: biosynthetic-type acetolactate synthase large subunit [Euryarchaeota archaeon]|nr:biosynthetic-type acetolactate synthase large subunit [Euryarchaeota archaeon]